MTKRLLIETRMNSLSLKESKGSYTPHPGCLGTLEGPCADLKKPTRNGYWYTKKLWENVFKDPIVVESLQDRVLIGELDHPEDRLETKAVNACIVMTDYRYDEDYLIGTFDILDTPCGRILKSLLDSGCKIGVSSRGEGDVVTEDGVDKIDEDTYSFMAFDAVVVPAVKAAKPTLKESINHTSLKESLKKEVESASTVSELEVIKKVVEATNLPESDSLMESVNNKSQELLNGTTSSSSLLEDLEQATGEINRLNEQIRLLKSDITTCKSKYAKQVKSRQKLKDESIASSRKATEMTKKYNSLVFESLASSKEISRLSEVLERTQETLNTLQKDHRTTRSELSKCETKIRDLEESLSKSQIECRRIIKENRDLSKTRDELQEKVRSLSESQRVSNKKLEESAQRTKSDIEKLSDKNKSLIEAYARSRCESNGVDCQEVLESVNPKMTISEIDSLVESVRSRQERYRSLPIIQDSLISSLDDVSVKFNGSQIKVNEELNRTSSFMDEANKLF